VIANAWTPASAPHNLLASADISWRIGSSSSVAWPPGEKSQRTPANLSELLDTPRSLSVTTNPDLNLLLQNIVTEVQESYPALSFPFQIEMLGTDLVREGITQNQRPGDFELKDQKLSDILTEIMFRANPDKTATSPADPKCKLVWAVVTDPDTNVAKIVVTTRVAAQEKGWELPPAFRVP
jgi:hypothetical protein